MRRRRQAGGASHRQREGRDSGGGAPGSLVGQGSQSSEGGQGFEEQRSRQRRQSGGGRKGRGSGLSDDAIAASRPKATAVEYGISMLAARAWPEKKLREKIRTRYSEEDTDAGLVRLKELRLVDDAAWAERYVRDRFERLGKGRHRIRMELIGKGIDAPTADAALDRVVGGEDERVKAAAMLEQMRSRLTRSPGASRSGIAAARGRGGEQEPHRGPGAGPGSGLETGSPNGGEGDPEQAPEEAREDAPVVDPRERRAQAERLKNRLFRRMLARGFPASVVRDLLDVS